MSVTRRLWPDLGFTAPQIMAVLNVTPDSFSDGGLLYGTDVPLDAVIDHAALCVAEGATLLDVGGESTRPGATPVSVEQELARVVPVIEALSSRFDAVISVDTSTPQVMTEAARLGAGLINDVRALTRPGALEAAHASGLPACLMHMQGSPDTMQQSPQYQDPVDEVLDWLMKRVEVCVAEGFDRQQLILDPGFGFGKTLAHNVSLFQNLARFIETGFPIMVGVSRKSMLGEITGRPVEQRTTASAVAAAMAAAGGAAIVRVHDVSETRDAVRVMHTLMQGTQ